LIFAILDVGNAYLGDVNVDDVGIRIEVGIAQVDVPDNASNTRRLFKRGSEKLKASRCQAAVKFLFGSIASGFNALWYGLCAIALFTLCALSLVWTLLAMIVDKEDPFSLLSWAGTHLVEQGKEGLKSIACAFLGLFLTLSALMDASRNRVISRVVVIKHTFDHELELAWSSSELEAPQPSNAGTADAQTSNSLATF